MQVKKTLFSDLRIMEMMLPFIAISPPKKHEDKWCRCFLLSYKLDAKTFQLTTGIPESAPEPQQLMYLFWTMARTPVANSYLCACRRRAEEPLLTLTNINFYFLSGVFPVATDVQVIFFNYL